jgi:hypothetical protein
MPEKPAIKSPAMNKSNLPTLARPAGGDHGVRLRQGLPELPERLLLAHAAGRVLFVAGAGVSMQPPASLPDFGALVREVVARLDDALVPHLAMPPAPCVKRQEVGAGPPLNAEQQALLARIDDKEFDVALGMLERRMDSDQDRESSVRRAVADVLRGAQRPAPIHAALVRLANRGAATAIATTNFDLLFESAARSLRKPLQRYALTDIPRPDPRPGFAGVMHLHGALDPDPNRHADLVLTDRDFGEQYLRRRGIPDFVYDAARIFHVVFVGYSANDPPMRYLLNAVAADGLRFPDLKERFAFVPTAPAQDDAGRAALAAEMAMWVGRGITPIPYDKSDGHRALTGVLAAWAALSPHEDKGAPVDREIRRVLRLERAGASEASRELFAHLFRRGSPEEQVRLAALGRNTRCDPAWLDGMLEIVRERGPDADREPLAHQLCRVFLHGRLAEKTILRWAAGLPAGAKTERNAVLEAIEWDLRGSSVSAPFCDAWHALAEAFGSHDEVRRGEDYALGRRIAQGDRSGALIADIARFVAPRLNVGYREASPFYSGRPPKTAKQAGDLLTMSVTSRTLDIGKGLSLGDVNEVEFLLQLAEALEAEVVRALHIGTRAGWGTGRGMVWLGGLTRLRLHRSTDPDGTDRFASGVAPSAHLLLHAVARLAVLSPADAAPFLSRWRSRPDPIHARMWAAAAVEPALASPAAVVSFLMDRPPEQRWFASRFPEIAELRAARFNTLAAADGAAVVSQLLGGPPFKLVRRGGTGEERRRLREGLAVSELTRIEAAGGVLPDAAHRWLRDRRAALSTFVSNAVDAGFPTSPRAHWVPPTPDTDLDALEDGALLEAAEDRLGEGRTYERRVDRVWDWLNVEGNSSRLAKALAHQDPDGQRFPATWMAALSRHRPPPVGASQKRVEEMVGEARDLLQHLPALSRRNAERVVSGAASWLVEWARRLAPNAALTKAIALWWPFAAAASERTGDATDYEESATADLKRVEHDALNSPVGHLAGAFLAICPNLADEPRPFADAGLRAVATLVAGTDGRAGQIARFRCAMDLSYLMAADPDWTEATLLRRLEAGGAEADALWRAVALSEMSGDSLARLGPLMARRATIADGLDRDTRQGLVERACHAVLSDLWHGRDDTALRGEVQQMLRLCPDDLRSRAATILESFVNGVTSGKASQAGPSTEEAFDRAVAPFLHSVWPKDQAAATPGVAEALAPLPAATGRRFAEAVAAVRRFLVPFEAWSLHSWRLAADDLRSVKHGVVVGADEARAALDLLDRTIGSDDGTRVPSDLGVALAHIVSQDGRLRRDPRFRRLAALSRE